VITTTPGRFVAVAFLLAAGAVGGTVLVTGGISNRFTLRDVLVLAAAVLVAAIAALWLYRDRRQHGGQS
jgi:membrane protein DedA with SNARE-associated domain